MMRLHASMESEDCLHSLTKFGERVRATRMLIHGLRKTAGAHFRIFR